MAGWLNRLRLFSEFVTIFGPLLVEEFLDKLFLNYNSIALVLKARRLKLLEYFLAENSDANFGKYAKHCRLNTF